jgi:hypothetical protein
MILLSLAGMVLFYSLFFYAIMKLHHVKNLPAPRSSWSIDQVFPH